MPLNMMLNPNALVPGTKYMHTYSYIEGLEFILPIVGSALLCALINLIISVIIGLRKKDCLVILVGSTMVKTIMIFLGHIFKANVILKIVLFTIDVIAEGIIYEKVLKYKERKGMTVSIICNCLFIYAYIIYLIVTY